MGKLTTYLVIMSGLMLLFYFGGLLPTECGEDGLCEVNTPSGKLLTILLRPENMRASTLGDWVIGILAGLAVVGSLVLSGLVYERLEYAAIAAFLGFLFVVVWDFIAVFNVVREAAPVLAILLFAPFLLVFILTVLEFMRGRD